MGAYDNMFSNASTFKVELDEWYSVLYFHFSAYSRFSLSCKILREATPRSLVILDGVFVSNNFCLSLLIQYRLQNSVVARLLS